MAFGDGADDAALDGAWSEFCERLKAAGRQAFKDFNATSGLQRADAFRFLTQNLGRPSIWPWKPATPAIR